jgi:hypothetical protein
MANVLATPDIGYVSRGALRNLLPGHSRQHQALDRTVFIEREESMTTTNAMRLASLVTAINVLVASGFSIVGIIRPQYLVPVESVPTEASLILALYAAARTLPLALLALGAIYKQATPSLLLLGALAGVMQFLDAGIGLFEGDVGKCAGPLFIAVLQFFVVYLLHRSVQPQPAQMNVRSGPVLHH